MSIQRITGDYRVGAYCPECTLNTSIPLEYFVSDNGKKLKSYQIKCNCGFKFVLCLPKEPAPGKVIA